MTQNKVNRKRNKSKKKKKNTDDWVIFSEELFKNSLFSSDEMTSPLFDNQLDGESRNGLCLVDLSTLLSKAR